MQIFASSAVHILAQMLAPCWHFLTLLESAQADFNAADNLTALVTLFIEQFAQAFSIPREGLMCTTLCDALGVQIE